MADLAEPLVAIGLPTYNREKILRHALDLLCAQTYRNFVLIVSDNASTDGTRALCESYAADDDRIQYILQKTNIGPNANFNFVLQEAMRAADFFLFASDDDAWDKYFLEKCMKKLIENPDSVQVSTGAAYIYDDGTSVTLDPKLYFPNEKDIYKRMKQYMLSYSYDGRGVAFAGVWRKKALEGNRVNEIDTYENDMSFIFRGLSYGPFELVPELLFYKAGRGIARGKEGSAPPPTKSVFSRIANQIVNCRVERAKTEIINMKFVLGIKELSLWQKIKLEAWNLFVIGRLFVKRKT